MSKLTRLYNFLIDSVMFFLFVLFFATLVQKFVEKATLKYFMIFFYYFYYLILEAFFGQTIGKMITKTIVVDSQTGQKPNFSKILVRTLARLIPIDFLSYFFVPNGIHDLLSKTELKQV